MIYNQPNLNQVLRGDAVSRCARAADAMARSRLGATSSIDWARTAGAIGDRVAEMFDIPLLGMIGAWANDGKRRTLPLFDRTVEASFKAHIDIEIAGMRTVRIEFEIVAEIEFEGIVLTIEHRAVRSIRLAACRAAVKVKCGGVVVVALESCELELPGEIRLADESAFVEPETYRATEIHPVWTVRSRPLPRGGPPHPH
jgi:hypothetical protein